ncbi:hypothetical protein BJX63DRAFT_395831 [Aspergillus granulosus]|uniref:Zn(2)-C6 fungal-type domain-containing protein n=1 Tax=Aspergillus granulosus TaxID=176169 RepID=A0ABR4HBV3_9EURO
MRGRKTKHTACVHCRQMKVACDRYKHPSESCSRCLRTNQPCTIDPSFKREIRRDRMSVLERELKEARQTKDNEAQEQDAQIPSHNNGLQCSSIGRTVRGVYLPNELIDFLLNEYYTHYHTFCPILSEQLHFFEYSGPSPLLFATVMVTALRRKTEHQSLYLELVKVTKTLISESIWPEKSNLLTMQVLLLLCHWPLPFEKSEDPSATFISQATVIGHRLGLHRPGCSADFDYGIIPSEQLERIRQLTWVVCVILNVSISAQIGIPPAIQIDQGPVLAIIMSKPGWLPDSLFSQLHIARHGVNISSWAEEYLSSDARSTMHESNTLIHHFENELRLLKSQFNDSSLPSEQLVFLGTKLMLYICALTASGSQTTADRTASASPLSSPNRWLLARAYLTATSIIQAALSLETGERWLYAPVRLHKIALNALCLLYLIKCSSVSGSDAIDQTMLGDTICRGQVLFKDLPIVPGDFMSRANAVFDKLTAIAATSRTRIPDLLQVKSRLGANAAFSAARRAKSAPSLWFSSATGAEVPEEPHEMISNPRALDNLLLLDIDLGELFGTDFGI